MTGAKPGHEQFPKPANAAHRHSPPVPGVEVADHAYPLGVRRPNGERYPLNPFVEEIMRPQLAIAAEMIALSKQMSVEFAENLRKAVDVLEFLVYPASRYSQPIAKRLLAVGNGSDE